MGEVLFYHLTRWPAERLLRELLTRALGQGWRVAVRGTDPDRLDWLDQKLWLGPEEEFLPHGLAGGPHDARQPVLLTTAGEAPNGARALAVIDGAAVAPDEAAGYERVWIVFDGGDAAAVARARDLWQAFTAAGLAPQYWSQASGSWVRARG
jgi:DNA polymerase-3 subunit chi